MDQMHPLLDKVRKLLAQAESPACTPAEAEAFTAKAAALVAAYGIDEALLAVVDDPARDPVADRVVDLHPPYAQEKAVLVSEVAHGLRCQAVLLRRRAWDEQWRSRTDVSVHVFGHGSDLRAVDVLLTSLLLQGTRDVIRTLVPSGEHAAAYRRTWWLGFAGSVGSRLRVFERDAAAEAEPRFAARGTSAALVLADRAADADDAMRAAYPDAGAAARRRLTGGGLGSGWSAGQRADLGGPGVGGAPRREIAG